MQKHSELILTLPSSESLSSSISLATSSPERLLLCCTAVPFCAMPGTASVAAMTRVNSALVNLASLLLGAEILEGPCWRL